MKTENQKYESGATTHAVNDLILFADNTPELVKLRDDIYKQASKADELNFSQLLMQSIQAYIKEFPQAEDHNHIKLMTTEQRGEFRRLYFIDFDNWKEENERTRKTVTVEYANGDTITTGINGTEAEVREYFKIGRFFNIGSGGEDNMQAIINITF